MADDDRLPLPPSWADLVQRFGLFGTGDASTRCAVDTDAEGAVSCSCSACASWKAFLREKPFYEASARARASRPPRSPAPTGPHRAATHL